MIKSKFNLFKDKKKVIIIGSLVFVLLGGIGVSVAYINTSSNSADNKVVESKSDISKKDNIKTYNENKSESSTNKEENKSTTEETKNSSEENKNSESVKESEEKQVSVGGTDISSSSNSSSTQSNNTSSSVSSGSAVSGNSSSSSNTVVSNSSSNSSSNTVNTNTNNSSSSNSNGGTVATTPVVEEKPAPAQVVEEVKPVAPPVVEEAPAPVTPPVVVEEPKPVEPAFVFPMSADDIFNYAMSISGNYTSQKGLIRDTNMNRYNSGWNMPMQFVKTDSLWSSDKIKTSIQEYWDISLKINYFEGDYWNIEVVDTGDMVELYMFY